MLPDSIVRKQSYSITNIILYKILNFKLFTLNTSPYQILNKSDALEKCHMLILSIPAQLPHWCPCQSEWYTYRIKRTNVLMLWCLLICPASSTATPPLQFTPPQYRTACMIWRLINSRINLGKKCWLFLKLNDFLDIGLLWNCHPHFPHRIKKSEKK